MTRLSVVGKDINRVDALEKVTGKAKYTADFKEPTLYAKVLRSPHAHARIINIDNNDTLSSSIGQAEKELNMEFNKFE